MDVSGIGTATFNSIKDHITVGELQSDEQEEEEEEEELPEQVASSTPPQTQTQTQNQTGGYPPPVLRAEIIGESTSLVGAGSFFDAAAYNAADFARHTGWMPRTTRSTIARAMKRM